MARQRTTTADQASAMTSTTAKAKKSSRQPTIAFAHKLVLNQWLLSLFNVTHFDALAKHLKNEALEGLDENNIHHYHHALTAHFFNLTQLPTELLLEYDQQIVRHTAQLNERRITHGEPPMVWKYFQYLTLLFTEIYLDRYFTDAPALLKALNEQIATYNHDKPVAEQLTPLDASAEAWSQLNKLAFWSATGSGKTLLMHVNILQYQFYLEKHGRSRELNRVLLLTPNEGLSQQHLREFTSAGIFAQIFRKDQRTIFTGQAVEIIEITRLRDDMGDKTIAIDAFEGNNLVLVDEGHRGTSSEDGAWLRFRNALCEKGFSFEYSATFGQAVKGKPKLIDLYAKNILFDYSYHYFYKDGFGKDYQIFNLDSGTHEQHRDTYQIACLLSFYQQLRLFAEQTKTFQAFQLEKPLWIFVGGSVTATLATRDASDIVEILQFLSRYVDNRSDSIREITNVLNQGLVTASGRDLFAGRFTYVLASGLTPTQIYDETLQLLFHAPGGGRLYLENLKGAQGEIALRVGADNQAFGVINVGDDAKLIKQCESKGLLTGDREFSGSLFHDINSPGSSVNVLIGSKKFTEGWSSWRVSTMGLMNVGKSEGAQIIQLFGRGVRLRGYGQSLKRSGQMTLPNGVIRPKYVGVLETLGIFGIHADYMAQFRDFLAEEGLPANDDRIAMFLPIINDLGTKRLRTIRLKKTINGINTEFGTAFRELAPIPTLTKPIPDAGGNPNYLQKNPVVLNWYPKIQALKSGQKESEVDETALNESYLTAHHCAFLDLERLYFELERFKAERGWFNFNVTRQGIKDLLTDHSWYRLQIPMAALSFDTFDKVAVWQEVAGSLLKKYADRFYGYRKRDWEMPHLEYRDLESDDPNFLRVEESSGESGYSVLIDQSQSDIVIRINQLKEAIAKGDLKSVEFSGLKVIRFDHHLYQPLLCLAGAGIEVSPVSLNEGETKFVEDLKKFHDKNADYFIERELYLLRNLSKGKGIGFFEAGNFHPDFILWLVSGDTQRICFVDPKGLRNIGKNDPKVQFYQTIKTIEKRLGDPNVILNSFIVSNTRAFLLEGLWSVDKATMNSWNIVFQEDDAESYISQILDVVSASVSAAR